MSNSVTIHLVTFAMLLKTNSMNWSAHSKNFSTDDSQHRPYNHLIQLLLLQLHFPAWFKKRVFALESTWWWSLIVDQVAASSILVRGAFWEPITQSWWALRILYTEDIRLDEDTVSKTAGGQKVASGFESLVFRCKNKDIYLINEASRSTLIRVARDMSAKHVRLSSNLNSVS